MGCILSYAVSWDECLKQNIARKLYGLRAIV